VRLAAAQISGDAREKRRRRARARDSVEDETLYTRKVGKERERERKSSARTVCRNSRTTAAAEEQLRNGAPRYFSNSNSKVRREKKKRKRKRKE